MSAHTPPPSSQPLTLGMLLYPGLTLLGLAGPQAALGMYGQTLLFWKKMDPGPTDSGISLNPTTTFADAPPELDVLFVPGGFGSNDAMADDGYRAATHWATYDILDALGVEAGRDRVVVDRNRFTGGGATAGIDFGLTLLAELRGEDAVKMTQLALEYDPKPPFNTGHPDVAGPELTAAARALMGQGMIRQGVEIAKSRRVAQAV